MIPPGLCQCGCGQPTKPYANTDRRRGQVAGQPRRFLRNHHGRTKNVPLSGYEIDETTGCWVWRLSRCSNGYGSLIQNGRNRMAHIVFWERTFGPVPDGRHLDHLCRNRACVNPAHLEPVTQAENNRRGDKTKLTEREVREIRASRDSQSELAHRFGVSVKNISAILRRETWKDVA